jgi:hypothetical protein
VVWEDGGGDPASYPIGGAWAREEVLSRLLTDPSNVANLLRLRKVVGSVKERINL